MKLLHCFNINEQLNVSWHIWLTRLLRHCIQACWYNTPYSRTLPYLNSSYIILVHRKEKNWIKIFFSTQRGIMFFTSKFVSRRALRKWTAEPTINDETIINIIISQTSLAVYFIIFSLEMVVSTSIYLDHLKKETSKRLLLLKKKGTVYNCLYQCGQWKQLLRVVINLYFYQYNYCWTLLSVTCPILSLIV